MTPESTPAHTVAAPPGLRALLAEIVDYAGLFPPAALALDDAMRRYARYRAEPEAWMLGRFVVPAARLAEVSAFAALFAQQPPFRFAVLGTGGQDTAAFEKSLSADLAAVAAFLERHAGRVEAGVLEVRLPDALLADADAVPAFVESLAARLAAAPIPRPDVFLEIPLTGGVPAVLPDLLAALAGRRGEMGLKLRTGGLDAAAFPDAEPLAAVLAACRDNGVRFKATAGLHHPVRQYHASVGTRMYGFLNVFGAAVLAAAHGLDAAALREVLLDETPGHFRFDGDAFAWKDLAVPAADVRVARRTLAVSFGSCSFDEPREDLAALGFFTLG